MPQRPVSSVIEGKSFVAITPSTTIRQVAHLMKSRHTSAVLVIDAKHHLLGICTERDLAVRVLAEDLPPESTQVAAVMTTDPVVIKPDMPFGHALHRMYEGGFRHVPVVDDQRRPLGLVCARDALDLDALQLEEDLVRREEITVIL
ncbi:MAG: CBS domain-containing protein [Zoogloeaceae bacterium]|nr:CBS domain-containing protein [Zoogloeaceae bacterium]